MNPWTVIGWIVFFAIAAVVIYFTLKLIISICIACVVVFKMWRRHLATRDTPPEKGQIWCEAGDEKSKVYIASVYPTHVNLTDKDPSYNIGSRCHWGHSMADWKTRVYNRKMILIGRWDE